MFDTMYQGINVAACISLVVRHNGHGNARSPNFRHCINCLAWYRLAHYCTHSPNCSFFPSIMHHTLVCRGSRTFPSLHIHHTHGSPGSVSLILSFLRALIIPVQLSSILSASASAPHEIEPHGSPVQVLYT